MSQWLGPFDEVVLVARVSDVSDVGADADAGVQVEGPGISVAGVPHYQGARQMVVRYRSVVRRINEICIDPNAFYGGKVPGVISTLTLRAARRMKAPTIVNVVGDPKEVLRTGAIGAIGTILAAAAARSMRRQLRTVDAAIYVSRSYLQQRYPVNRAAMQMARSNVKLPEAAFVTDRESRNDPSAFRVIAIGSQDQLYKGHDLLIEAIADLRQSGIPAELDLLGDGRWQGFLQKHAASLSVAEHVHFHGHVQDPSLVRNFLDRADLFAMPSRTEGLPRALVEAMARGLPCIGSDVGAIPELLTPDALFVSNSRVALSAAMASAFRDRAWQAETSRTNLRTAREIGASVELGRFHSFLVGFVDRFERNGMSRRES